MTIAVFLADDHAVVRDGLRYLLEAQPDIKVIGDAATGRQTLQLVKQLHPDVAIIDIAMPELNGIEAARRICSDCPSTRVIILSIYSTEEHVSRALRAGARGYVLKEAAGIEVVNAVRAVHSGHHYLSQKLSDQLIDDYLHHIKSSGETSPLDRLSPREKEVLQLVVEGESSAEIASVLSLSVKTVETYRSRIFTKLEIDDLPSLVKFAIQHGLTPLD
jgi:DNA-binding NarL/FixJ family response regulator